MFCSKCGKPIAEGSAFCGNCGAKVGAAAPAAPTQASASAKGTIRIRCAACGTVSDVQEDTACPKCRAALPQPAGYVKLYRMGNPLGCAAALGIYVDNVPMGYIGNTQTRWVRVPYGSHTFHCAMQMNRRCNDTAITLSAEQPVAGLRVAIKMGVWANSFVLTPCDPGELPD